MRIPFSLWRAVAIVLMSLSCGSGLRAQATDYPSKPVRLMVSASTGSASDLNARRLALRMGEALGVPFIVENRPGASSTLGGEAVARAPADGYTALFAGNNEMVWAPALGVPTRYDATRDLEPVGLFGVGYAMIVAHPSLGARSLADLVAWARARPGELLCGTIGPGSGQDVVCELLARRFGLSLQKVPYKGGGAMMVDLAAGQIHVGHGFMVEVERQYLIPGRLTAIAITGPRRLSRLPDVPTMAELGHGEFEFSGWNGLFVPSGTPAAIVRKLNETMIRVIRETDIGALIAERGSEALPLSPEAFRAFHLTNLREVRRLTSELGIKAETMR